MSGQQHTAEGTTVTVKASPEWIAKDICACAHAAKSPEAMMAVVEMATGYLTRLATAESALAGIRDPAAFVARARAIEAVAKECDALFALGVGGTGCISEFQEVKTNANRCISDARGILEKLRSALALPGGAA